ncbi:MAG: methylenetetrahydrofolate reductase [Candidatus Limnocylindrales bacterium]
MPVRGAPSPADRAALAALVAAPKFELIPLANALAEASVLPAEATVTVTSSQARGMAASVELCGALRERGHDVVPHLSAHLIRDRAELRDLLRILAGMGVRRTFVVGGDGPVTGDFPDGLSLLRAMADSGHDFTEIGVPCYPEGHPAISDARLDEVLVEKAAWADYMVSQMCFDAGVISSWLLARRARGLTLPLHLGLPGAAPLHRLMSISARIGVADSRRFLTKNPRFVSRLLLAPGGYRPDGLLDALASVVSDPAAAVTGLHIFTFNQVQSTEAWRAQYLATLRGPAV